MSSPATGWIWTSQPYDNNAPHLCDFRRAFTLPAAPQHAVVRLTADSRYRLFVNGQAVCCGPRKGDAQVWYYDEIDLAPWLHPGENVLAAVVLRYPENLVQSTRSIWRMKLPALYLTGSAVWPGGSLELTAGADWRARLAGQITLGPNTPAHNLIYMQETVAPAPELQGWLRPGYDDSAWPAALAYAPGTFLPTVPPAYLLPRPIPFLYEKPEAFRLFQAEQSNQSAAWAALLQGTPLALPPHTTETVVLCADRLTTGYLELAVSGGAGAQVALQQSEGYTLPGGDAHQPPKGDRLDWRHGTLQGPTDEYAVNGTGTPEMPEEYEPFWFRTFRLVRVRVTTGAAPLTLHRLAYRETAYPLEVKTQVETSDASLAEIWRISENSLRNCMHETYEDCPFYEQLQYAMDARAEMLYTYAVAADDRLARAALDDFARSQRADGLLNACAPAYKPNVIPLFSLYYILMLHDHMMYFGDAALVRRYLPVAERILDFFANLTTPASGGLVGAIPGAGTLGGRYWAFVDWAKGWPLGVPPTPAGQPATINSLLYCLALQAAAALTEFVGRRDQAAEYRTAATALQQAVRRLCTGPNGLLQDTPGTEQYSQHVQVFAVLTDTLTGPAARAALQATLGHGEMPQCTIAMGLYLFGALQKTGLYAYTDQLWEKWRRMLAQNLTTCVESDDENPRSDCHAWGAAALYELPAVTLGVRPAKPGFAAVTIAPTPGYLSWAKGTVITPRGPVQVSWRMENGQLVKNVTLPEGMELVEE